MKKFNISSILFLCFIVFSSCAETLIIEKVKKDLDNGVKYTYIDLIHKLGNPRDTREKNDELIAVWEFYDFEKSQVARRAYSKTLKVIFDKDTQQIKKWEYKER
jgi:hypothetical protein